jgi:hypothetical protein
MMKNVCWVLGVLALGASASADDNGMIEIGRARETISLDRVMSSPA